MSDADLGEYTLNEIRRMERIAGELRALEYQLTTLGKRATETGRPDLGAAAMGCLAYLSGIYGEQMNRGSHYLPLTERLKRLSTEHEDVYAEAAAHLQLQDRVLRSAQDRMIELQREVTRLTSELLTREGAQGVRS